MSTEQQDYNLDPRIVEQILLVLDGADAMAQSELLNSAGKTVESPKPKRSEDDIRDALALIVKAVRENPQAIGDFLRMLRRLPQRISLL